MTNTPIEFIDDIPTVVQLMVHSARAYEAPTDVELLFLSKILLDNSLGYITAEVEFFESGMDAGTIMRASVVTKDKHAHMYEISLAYARNAESYPMERIPYKHKDAGIAMFEEAL